MQPDFYKCSSCNEEFNFDFRWAYYHVGAPAVGDRVTGRELLTAPTRPAWCLQCEKVSLAEDIEPVRAFEDAYGAAKAGRPIEYPFASECLDPGLVTGHAAAYLRWRMDRRHAPRVVCCGGARFQFLDVAQPLLKHAGCEFGFIEAMLIIGSHNGPGPGVFAPANSPLLSPEGELIGLLTWRERGSDTWQVEPRTYPPSETV